MIGSLAFKMLSSSLTSLLTIKTSLDGDTSPWFQEHPRWEAVVRAKLFKWWADLNCWHPFYQMSGTRMRSLYSIASFWISLVVQW